GDALAGAGLAAAGEARIIAADHGRLARSFRGHGLRGAALLGRFGFCLGLGRGLARRFALRRSCLLRYRRLLSGSLFLRRGLLLGGGLLRCGLLLFFAGSFLGHVASLPDEFHSYNLLTIIGGLSKSAALAA